MLVSSLLAFSAIATASPFKFPLANGFPALSPGNLSIVEKQAGGTLPNTGLPKKLKPTGVLDFQVIAANEIFEVAFFSSLLNNVTKGVAGYKDTGYNQSYIVHTLTQIRAQEELHATGANAILTNAGHKAIKPCEYIFPATNFDEAIALANTFTDVVLGTLQSVQMQLAVDGGAERTALVPLIGSIIGQEAEQDGFYRFAQNKVPSAAPFLTGSAGQFAYNAIRQLFFVPGSCPNPPAVPEFAALNIAKQPPAKNSTLTFSTTTGGTTANTITYLSGQNLPVTVAITDSRIQGDVTTFEASFPFGAGFSKGLTIAALTKGKGPFKSIAEVANATLAGPGIIQVD